MSADNCNGPWYSQLHRISQYDLAQIAIAKGPWIKIRFRHIWGRDTAHVPGTEIHDRSQRGCGVSETPRINGRVGFMAALLGSERSYETRTSERDPADFSDGHQIDRLAVYGRPWSG